MTPPVTYNPTVTALLGSEAIIQTQQFSVLHQPLAGLDEGTHYSLTEALTLLPAGPLKNAGKLFAETPNVTFSYKLATVNGEVVPEFAFLREMPAPVPYKNGTYLSSTGTGGPSGEPAPASSFSANMGSFVILVGASEALSKAGVPNQVAAPFLGGSYALADSASTFFFKTPATPLNSALKGNLASMGIFTGAQTGFSYGLDAVGIKMGTDANTWGSFGGTLLMMAPAVDSPMNPVYWPEFANAFRSAIGVGIGGAAEGSSIYMASGGWAGGAGLGGAAMQGLGAAGAVLMGSSLGGWITDHATGMDDASDSEGQLAKLVLNRFKSDAWGSVGESPFGSLMAGIISPVLADGMEIAQDQIVSESKLWSGVTMDTVLISALMVNSDKKGEAMDWNGFEKSLKLFYQRNSDAIYAQDSVSQLLRKNGLVGDGDLGITRFVDNNGDITNREGLKKYAIEMMETHLKLRNQEIERILKKNDLIVGDDGKIASKDGNPFTEDQLNAIRTTRETLGRGFMRITNALATLRDEETLSQAK